MQFLEVAGIAVAVSVGTYLGFVAFAWCLVASINWFVRRLGDG